MCTYTCPNRAFRSSANSYCFQKGRGNRHAHVDRDCFVDGDKELVDDESLFLFGLMGQLSELITTRQSVLVNL
ncbi:hypothetical protein NXX23_17875 [Bacteroides ovatus]|nr:hypothetical protein [Bacteroides ovatus]